ncbi:hypothetical protein ACHAXA_011429 [Cyclostephanos tholiformis]|uniref:Uncharacterized protein n=1 Tax=Cyclostephanos tholiformis TaxID=382380 RepID=A0ABD3RH45_9STRA
MTMDMITLLILLSSPAPSFALSTPRNGRLMNGLDANNMNSKEAGDNLRGGKNGRRSRRHRALYAWQTATPYADPDALCAAGATGYRATRDCSGFVFCNNGYLMGGAQTTREPTPNDGALDIIQSVVVDGSPPPSAEIFDVPVMGQVEDDDTLVPSASELVTFDVSSEVDEVGRYDFETGKGWKGESWSPSCPESFTGNLAYPECTGYATCIDGIFVDMIPQLSIASTTSSPVFRFEGDPTRRFCGKSWKDVIDNCLTAVPCPDGDSFGVCPYGMGCIADTPCSDETYLEYLRERQQEYGAGDSPPTMSTSSSPPTDRTTSAMISFGSSLSDATTLTTTSSVPTTATTVSMSSSSPSSITTVATILTIASSPPTTASTLSMSSPSSSTITQVTAMMTSLYENPTENMYFCGLTYADILVRCLESKPCPTGVAADFCESTEGCFAAPTCTEEYLLNKADVSSEEFSLVETVASSSPTASVSSNHPTILLSADPSPSPLMLVMSGMVAPSNDGAHEEQTTSPSLNTIQESTFATSKPVITDVNPDPMMNSESILEYTENFEGSDISALPDSVSTICRLCGDSELDSTQIVTLDGNEVSCNMFDLGFESANIEEGSNICVDYRGLYFNTCCGRLSFEVDQSSVEKCILCGDSTLNRDAIIFFHGKELFCTDLASQLLEEDRVNSGSAICNTSKSSYAAACCSDDSGTSLGEVLLSSGFSPATPETSPEYWSAESWNAESWNSHSLLNHASTTAIRFGSSMAVLLCLLQIA